MVLDDPNTQLLPQKQEFLSEDASLASNLSKTDHKQILYLSNDPNIAERIVQPIVPTICGNKHDKMDLVISLCGAMSKNVDNKHHV